MDYDLSKNWVSIREQSVNLIECVDLFESGYNQIYIVDDNDKFCGMVIRKQNFKNVWDDNKWITYINEDEYICDISDDYIVDCKIQEIQNNNPEVKEIPIILDQSISAIVILDNKIKKSEFDWGFFIYYRMLEWIYNFKNIYLSSINNKDLLQFYKIFHNVIRIQLLNEDNIDKVFSDPKGILICKNNIFPNLIKKVTLDELAKIMFGQYIKELECNVVFSDQWKCLNIDKVDMYSCIKMFDEGCNSIYLIDKDENYRGTICRHNFKEDFPWNNIRKWNNIYMDQDNEFDITSSLLKAYFGTGREEIPILSNNKIVKNTKLNGKIQLFELLPLNWELIPIKYVKKYFNNKRILISSLTLELSKFYDNYSSFLDISIMDNQNSFKKYLSGDYDYFLYKSDVWLDNCNTIEIDLVYLDLLGSVVEDWLLQQGVQYYYFECPLHNGEIYNYQYRNSELKPKMKIPINYTINADLKDGYLQYADFDGDGCKVEDGHRKTIYKGRFKHSIFFYGACVGFGMFADDEQTIPSFLQKNIDSYSVRNYGMVFGKQIKADLNLLLSILHTPFNQGDIVIQFGFNMWKGGIKKKDKYYKIADILNSYENCNEKCFVDWCAHFDAHGNKIIADGIYNIIKPRLFI